MKSTSCRTLLAILTMLLPVGLTAGATVADAQYFGKNKVQYEDFDYQILETPHFSIYYYDRERAAVERAARMLERWYHRLSRTLNHEFEDRQPIILYASHPDFRQTDVVRERIGEGTGGITEPIKRRIVMPFAGPLAETDHVLGHELVHAFQYDILGTGASGQPLWLVEGMAEYLSLGPVHAQTAMWLRDALQHDRLPAVSDLRDPSFFPYRYGHGFLAYLGGRFGDAAVRAVLKAARGNAVQTVVRVTGVPSDTLTRDWHESVRRAYAPLRESTGGGSDFGRALFESGDAGAVNVSPSLSPDGSKIAFMSEKSQFAIEIFVADVETGEIERKLTETALDPHFESLQFIKSAGAWHPDGDRLAIAAVESGRPVISILDIQTGDRTREFQFEELGEIFNPTWSPDGRRIAFAALEGGTMDLFVYEVDDGQLHRLTDDPHAELQPAWSPDGEWIAFATDRFTSDISTLNFEGYTLAMIHPDGSGLTEVPGFSRGRHLNPHWSPDGRSLVFISDLNGIPNVYRVELESGRFTQLTNLFTGVSGITPLSPAVTVASRTGELAFSVYEDGGYKLYHNARPGSLETPVGAARVASAEPAVLPPVEAARSDVFALLEDPEVGLPPATVEYASRDYSVDFSLDRITQPRVVAGVDQFGALVGGGASIFFSDMLGQHLIGGTLNIAGNFDNLTAAAAYQNSDNRLIWGGTAQRLPLVFSQFRVAETMVDGEPALIREEATFRQTSYRIVGTAWYPLSEVQRLEFSGGFRRTTLDLEVERQVISRVTGAVLQEERIDDDPFDPLNLGTASAALVYDNSLFGATSPIAGQRYRFEVTPLAGTLTFIEGLADYRRYFMPARPFTLAFRALHFGRYGGDASDSRLSDVFVGFPGLIRGYERRSFSSDECDPVEGDPCPVLNQLFGSRVAVANAELRFPLFGALGIGEGYYGALPIEMAIFGDAGMAWESDVASTPQDEDAFFLGGDREPVFSAGVTLRGNVGGVLVLQLDFTRAFERDEWVTSFGFLPGF